MSRRGRNPQRIAAEFGDDLITGPVKAGRISNIGRPPQL
jgi:hypothetical protein